MIKVHVIGRLGKDPELKTSTTGKKFAILSIASNSHRRNSEGKEIVDWISVFTWDKQAEVAVNHLQKGSQVYVECSYSSTEKGPLFNAREVVFLGGIGQPKPKKMDEILDGLETLQGPSRIDSDIIPF